MTPAVVLCDPGTIGTLIVATLVSAEAASVAVIGTVTVAHIVGTAVIIGASIALSYALRPEPPKPQDGQAITRQPIAGRRRGYGRIKVAGPLVFSESSAGAGARRSQVIALHHGEIDAIEEHWLSEFHVTFGLLFDASAAALPGNVGNGSIALGGASGPVGTYHVRFIATAADGGTFRVTDAVAANLGEVTLAGGTGSFAGPPLQLDVTDGSVDFAIGDGWDITITTGTAGQVTSHYTLGGSAHVSIDTRLGTSSQSAYLQLAAAYPALWSVAHQGLGVASALVQTLQPNEPEDLTTVYPGGLPPAYRAVIRASKVWDPRDGDQDKDDPATWTWSQNPVLIALDYHRHADGLGLAAFDGVLFTAAAIDEDWIPAADICDENVGGVTRYVCAGSYSLPEDAPANVLIAIFNTCDGQTYQRSDGAIGIRVGKVIAPSIVIGDDDILGYEGFRKGDNVFLASNEITAKYTSPDHDYQEADAQPWRDDADITERGQVLTHSLALQWVPNHSQARRLMKLAMYRVNPEWQGRVVTNLAGLAVLNERYITLQISELGIDGTFELTSFEIAIGDQAVTCAIGVWSLEQAAFDWNEGAEAGTPAPVPDGVMGE